MSNEKLREEFEAAAKARWPGNRKLLLRINLPGAACDGDYDNPIVHHAWWAWQSSRAAVVVELPKIVGYEGAYDSLQDHEFCPRMTDVDNADEVFGLCRSIEVQEAIEAAGLKVKS